MPSVHEASVDEYIRTVGAAPAAHEVVVLSADERPVGRLRFSPSLRVVGTSADRVAPFSAVLPLGASLKPAFASMLQDDDPLIAVTDSGRYVGVLTLQGLHRAMRRSAAPTAIGE
jgi:hypothetical protein